MPARARPRYMALGIALLAFGVLAILSIGLPFLVLGLVFLVGGLTDAPGRSPSVFWPLVATVGVFFTGYALVAPMWCSTEDSATEARPTTQGATRQAESATTTCRSLARLQYTADVGDDPPTWPALTTGVVAGIAAGLTTRRAQGAR